MPSSGHEWHYTHCPRFTTWSSMKLPNFSILTCFILTTQASKTLKYPCTCPVLSTVRAKTHTLLMRHSSVTAFHRLPICDREHVWLTGVLPSDRVVMLIDMLILSEEEREGGEGLLFSASCLWRKSRQARWILHVETTCKHKASVVKHSLIAFMLTKRTTFSATRRLSSKTQQKDAVGSQTFSEE